MTQKMQKINFDLSCFKDEFQEYLFKMANVNHYYEFINQYQNQFSVNLLPILKVDDDCTFQSITDSTEPNEPNEPNEPSDQQDELKIIASTILKKYNESSHQNKNVELKNIKDRLKLILEETSTN